jgi:hypothetical protein
MILLRRFSSPGDAIACGRRNTHTNAKVAVRIDSQLTSCLLAARALPDAPPKLLYCKDIPDFLGTNRGIPKFGPPLAIPLDVGENKRSKTEVAK